MIITICDECLFLTELFCLNLRQIYLQLLFEKMVSFETYDTSVFAILVEEHILEQADGSNQEAYSKNSDQNVAPYHGCIYFSSSRSKLCKIAAARDRSKVFEWFGSFSDRSCLGCEVFIVSTFHGGCFTVG